MKAMIYFVLYLSVIFGTVWIINYPLIKGDKKSSIVSQALDDQEHKATIQHRLSIQSKCGISDAELMDSAWAKIDVCIGEKEHRGQNDFGNLTYDQTRVIQRNY